MSKLQEALATYKATGIKVHEGLLEKVAKGLGPSLYNKDSSLVAASDKSELKTIKEKFLIKKLGLTDGPHLDKAIQEVIDTMGRSNRNKHRAIFYALLVEKFDKQAIYK